MNILYTLLMSTFYFFNPSTHQYLQVGSNGPLLSSTPQPIELTETTDNTGRYDDTNSTTWVIKQLDADRGIYTIGYRVADANATSFLYADKASNTLSSTYAEPGMELKEGQWLVADHDFENQQITLDESQTFAFPSLDRPFADVALTRTMYAGEWNSFCVPFAISEEQIKAVWGEGTLVAKLDRFDGTKLYFGYTQSISAGEPCIVCPATVHADNHTYLFRDIAKESWTNASDASPSTTVSTMHVVASYQPTTAPVGSFVLTGNNRMVHLTKATMMKGYRAYFVDRSVSSGKQLVWGLDGTTGISRPSVNKASASSNIYHIDGRLVRQKATTTMGLKPGIYIFKGKKVKK